MEVLPDVRGTLVQQLGDCSKVPVDHIDLVNHRIRCHKLEIFNYDDPVSFTPDEEEEATEYGWGPLYSDHTDDIERTLELVAELDCLIRRIEQMQLLINDLREAKQLKFLHAKDTDPPPEPEPEKEQVPLRCQIPKPEPTEEEIERQKQLGEYVQDGDRWIISCTEKLEVRDLEKSHRTLQCELDEMICNFRHLRQILRNLRTQMAIENRRLRKLGAVTGEYHEWNLQVRREMNVCKQRYDRLLKLKLSKSEAKFVIDANFNKAYKRRKTFVSWNQLRHDLREFHSELDEVTQYADDLRNDTVRRYSYLKSKEDEEDESSTQDTNEPDFVTEGEA